ncbi:MAG: hypothetical protein QXS85_00065 [Acidilobaceae archaeon]
MDLGERLRLFLAEYGERGYVVLKAVLDEAKSNKLRVRLGDVSAKGVRERLKLAGIEYNPVPLLTKLEKEVGLLETTYKSSSQHWWKVLDLSLLEEVLREYSGGDEEPVATSTLDSLEARVFRIQLEVIGLRDIARRVSVIAGKGRLGPSDWATIRKTVLEDVPLLVRIKKDIETSGLAEEFREELELIESVIATIESIISKGRQQETRSLSYNIAYLRGSLKEQE